VEDSIYNVEVAVGIVLARGEVHLALDRQQCLMMNAATLKSFNNSLNNEYVTGSIYNVEVAVGIVLARIVVAASRRF
jgi:hypothetical protein